MEGMWFTTNYYESLGDIWTKFSFLNLKDEIVIDLIDDESFIFLSAIIKEEDMEYFSYDLKYDKSGDMVTILPDNILCALWFIGIFPKNTKTVLKENRFENQNIIYTFDTKSHKLKKKKYE